MHLTVLELGMLRSYVLEYTLDRKLGLSSLASVASPLAICRCCASHMRQDQGFADTRLSCHSSLYTPFTVPVPEPTHPAVYAFAACVLACTSATLTIPRAGSH